MQGGNNRFPCFLDDCDRLDYLHLLRQALTATGVRLHAYALTDNHVHLLATQVAPGNVSRMMQKFGRQSALWRGLLDEALSQQQLVEFGDYLEQQRPRIATPSAQWSKPRPAASQAPGLPSLAKAG